MKAHARNGEHRSGSSDSEGDDESLSTSNHRPSQPDNQRNGLSPFLRASASSSALSSSRRRSVEARFDIALGAEGRPVPPIQFDQHRRTSSSEGTVFGQWSGGRGSSRAHASSAPLAGGTSALTSGTPQRLFTPAGDTIPPIATSRSTTAILMKKKQLHQSQQQQLAISSMFPWTGHLNASASTAGGSGSSSGAASMSGSSAGTPYGHTMPPPPQPHLLPQMAPLTPHVQVPTHAQVQQGLPLPDHPPPPYSVACPEGTAQDAYTSSMSSVVGRHARTQSSPAHPSEFAPGPSSVPGLIGPSSSPSAVASSALRNRSPVRAHMEPQYRFQADFNSWTPSHSQSPSQSHSTVPSASSSRVSFTPPSSAPHRSSAGVHFAQRDSDWDSSSDDDSRGGRDDQDAIYTSPTRRRKGKGRASLSDDDEDTTTPISGHSSSVHPMHEPDQRLHDRRHSRHLSQLSDDDSEVSGRGLHSTEDGRYVQQAMPKSCLKPTPSSSSASIATTHLPSPSASSSSVSAQHEASASSSKTKGQPGLGVRFVRFTLGLRSGKAKGKEREKEPKLICTTPGRACAGETETETDEPSSRRLPTARKPSHPSNLGSSAFSFGTWNRSSPLRPPSAAHSGSSPLRSSLSASITPSPPLTRSESFSSTSKVTAFFFQFFRLLSVVPALCGVIYCIWMLVRLGGVGSEEERRVGKEYVEKYWACVPLPPGSFPFSGVAKGAMLPCDEGRGVLRGPPVPGRVDWVVTAFWALLTAHHCLGLSTGLFARWKVYYTPSSTLVRLLALQGICWPATQLTLGVIGGGRRPVAAWAVIGTCTAVSRSVQIWVTSNIVRESEDEGGDEVEGHTNAKGPGMMMRFVHAFAAAVGGGGGEDGSSEDDEGEVNDAAPVMRNAVPVNLDLDDSMFDSSEPESPLVTRLKKRRRRGKRRYRERWWDWKEVGLKCMLPTGLVYFLMAWAEVGRREWGTWYGGYDGYAYGHQFLEGAGLVMQ